MSRYPAALHFHSLIRDIEILKDMLLIPEYILVQFKNALRQRAIPDSFHVHYRKGPNRSSPPEAYPEIENSVGGGENYDIRTIQTMLGHADVRTKMIYTHCVPGKTAKEAKSRWIAESSAGFLLLCVIPLLHYCYYLQPNEVLNARNV